MNIVDLVAIVPFYLEMTLALFGVDVASLSDIKGIRKKLFLFVQSYFFFALIFYENLIPIDEITKHFILKIKWTENYAKSVFKIKYLRIVQQF